MEGPRVKTEGVKSGDGVIALNCGEEFSVMGMNCYNGCGLTTKERTKVLTMT